MATVRVGASCLAIAISIANFGGVNGAVLDRIGKRIYMTRCSIASPRGEDIPPSRNSPLA